LSDGTPVFLAIIDNVMATRLKANPKYQTIMINADVRGARNALISGVIGKASNVVYVEAPVFYGTTKKKDHLILYLTQQYNSQVLDVTQ